MPDIAFLLMSLRRNMRKIIISLYALFFLGISVDKLKFTITDQKDSFAFPEKRSS